MFVFAAKRELGSFDSDYQGPVRSVQGFRLYFQVDDSQECHA